MSALIPQILFETHERQIVWYSIKGFSFQVERAKALHSLIGRIDELQTDALFFEALNGIRAWINEAGVDTRLADVEKKSQEAESIVG